MIMATICPKCRGTILARAQNGAARGTCNCQSAIARPADRVEGWEQSGPPRPLADLPRHAVVRLPLEKRLRRVEKKTQTGARLAYLDGDPETISAPLTMQVTPYQYLRRRS